MKKKKYLIVILLLVLLVTSFLLISKKPNTKNKKLKELNYNVTYKEAFPDENLRRGVLLCIMRDKCNDLGDYTFLKKNENIVFLDVGVQFYDNSNFLADSRLGPVITEAELEAKENEQISKIALEKLQILVANNMEKEITSLQGIEYLPNIKDIVLKDVKQEHIDLSYNKELVKLQIYAPKTTSINFEQNVKLRYIYSVFSKNETILDLSNLTNLYKIDIEYTNIKNIILPQGIREVNLSNNTLSSLDVPSGVRWLEAENSKLKNITLRSGLEDLNLRENNLTHIDLPEGVKLVNLNKNQLESLVIPSSVSIMRAEENKISNDVVVPNGVEYLELFDNKISNITLAPSLKTIELSKNNISNIDLSNLVNAEKLWLAKNPLQSIDVTGMPKLKDLLLYKTKIKNNIDLRNNVDLEMFKIGGVEEGEEPKVENFDFTNNLKLRTLEIKDRNLKNFDLEKYVNLIQITLENNIMNPNLDLSRLTNLSNYLTIIDLTNNKLTNLKVPDKNINNFYLDGKETIKLKVKKNSYVTIPKVLLNNKEYFLRGGFYYRNGETYLFNTVGKITTEVIGYPTTASNASHEGNFVWTYEIEVEVGEEDSFNPSIDQGNYTPLINEEIPVNKLKEMITNLPANIKNFEVLSQNTFTSKGDKNIKVKITFSDDTVKEINIPVKVYEKEYLMPEVEIINPNIEVVESKEIKEIKINIKEVNERVDSASFIKYVKDDLILETINNLNGLTNTLNKRLTGKFTYNFTGTEEEKDIDIIYTRDYKNSGDIKHINIKLLRDTDSDGTPDRDDDDKDGDGVSNAVEIARGSDPYNKDSFPDMSKKDELDNLVKQLEKLIEDTKVNPFDNKNKLDVDNLKNNFLPGKTTEKDNIKSSYDNTTGDTELVKLKEKVKEIIDDIKKEINKLRDKASFIELDKEIAKEIDEDFYLEDEVKALKDKIKEAKNLDRNTSTQEEVDKLTKDIKDLRDKLVINKSKLKDKIDELEKKIEDNSCREEDCKKVLHLAKDLYNKESFTKKEMLDMIEKLDNLLNRKGSLLNPKTGIKTYSLVILFIIFISYLVFKKHKNYIR